MVASWLSACERLVRISFAKSGLAATNFSLDSCRLLARDTLFKIFLFPFQAVLPRLQCQSTHQDQRKSPSQPWFGSHLFLVPPPLAPVRLTQHLPFD